MALASANTAYKVPLADRAAFWLFKTLGSGRQRVSRAPWDFGTPLATKADPAGSLIVSSYGLSQPVRTPRRFDKLADEGYNQNPLVYRGIDVIATACAGIEPVLYQRTGQAKRGKKLVTHPLLDRLEQPNETQGYAAWFKAYVSYLYVAGNSYLWANRPGKTAPPAELWTMRPDRMRVIPDAKQFVSGYTYEVNGDRIDFDKASVLHTKTFAPLDDWYGMSPLAVAARAIDIHNAGGDWNLAAVQNSGKVPGFFTVKERLGDTQFERMREQFVERYTGRRNVGLPGLLDGGDISWLETGKTPLDMDWDKLDTKQARYISIALGVPPELLGDSEVKTYANYQEARASFYEETVLPLMDFLFAEFNRWLVPMYGADLWLSYDRNDIEALQEQRGRLYQWVGKSTALTVNEQRDILGYEARPEGDVIIVPAQTATLDEVMAGMVPGGQPGKPLAPPKPAMPNAGRPNDGSTADEGAPTPGPDAADNPGGSGVPDGGMGSAVDASAKSYDPLDDILAGKVVHLEDYRPRSSPKAHSDPKASRPQSQRTKRPPARTPSPYQRLPRIVNN